MTCWNELCRFALTQYLQQVDCSIVCLVNQSLMLIQNSTGRWHAGSRLLQPAVTEADIVLLASSGMFMNGLTRIV